MNEKENGPQRLMHLNAWSLFGGTIGEELGGVALLEEVYHLRLHSPHHSQISLSLPSSLCLLVVDHRVSLAFASQVTGGELCTAEPRSPRQALEGKSLPPSKAPPPP